MNQSSNRRRKSDQPNRAPKGLFRVTSGKTVLVSNLDDDFGTASKLVKAQTIDETYPYQRRNPLWHLAAMVLYYLIAPLLVVVVAWYYGVRVRNRKAIWKVSGCYLYCTHNHWIDFMLPYLVTWPKRAHVIAAPTGFSITGVRHLVAMMGGVPLNTTEAGKAKMRGFLTDAIDAGRVVAIMPEAHLWPYYTGIRDYPNYSFTYPVRDSKPVIAYAVTYRQRRWLKFRPPCLTITLSDPIPPESWQDSPDPKQALRDQVHRFMCNTVRAKTNFQWIEYLEAKEGIE